MSGEVGVGGGHLDVKCGVGEASDVGGEGSIAGVSNVVGITTEAAIR